ncbi:Bug family tripartite tricarboxylate transporter substrate binding protein [Falsiroseomonas stagni]|uniref:Tripartite-type tricarboxylate transporter, receptor component TctC n=1 Tax=Falsiroseomonas stagni DSM 19981 TaxID=1123062 RepID=A0A1I4FCQ0_9PROT|nr:tripartite tricarboxylate transporter substrate binding protein [Falsiroseomonas stagni]SFL14657.1 Tripartite-type tricarboxylate transporter, receptor component TctC [Falsiroseomonas stagni DSM 19981]
MMNLGRRTLLISSLMAPATLQAQPAFPSRPIRLVVPFAPGGPSDTLARVFAERLAAVLGQPMPVENRSGAGSTVGSDAVAKAAPDGYTLLFNNISQATNAAFFSRLPFDPLKDFAPVGLLAESPVVLLGAPNLPVSDLQSFLALVRDNPGRYDYGSAGNGTAAHLAVAKLLAMAGLRMNHVPYRGVAPATNDLMAGTIALVGDTATTGLGQARGGRLKGLAVTSARRMPQAPEISTVAESGFPGLADYTMTSWNMLLSPAGTPEPVVARLNEAVRQAKADPAFQARLEALGNTLMDDAAPHAISAFLAAEQGRWGEVLRAAGIRPD